MHMQKGYLDLRLLAYMCRNYTDTYPHQHRSRHRRQAVKQTNVLRQTGRHACTSVHGLVEMSDGQNDENLRTLRRPKVPRSNTGSGSRGLSAFGNSESE